jgi:hypothetical protein
VDVLDFVPTGEFKLNYSFEMAERLMGTSAFHKEVFEYNLGLAKKDFFEVYQAKKAVSCGST